jgi:hypothetical protein
MEIRRMDDSIANGYQTSRVFDYAFASFAVPAARVDAFVTDAVAIDAIEYFVVAAVADIRN